MHWICHYESARFFGIREISLRGMPPDQRQYTQPGNSREIPLALYVNLPVFPQMSKHLPRANPTLSAGFEAMLPPATNQPRHRHTLEFLNLAPTTVKKLPVFVQQLPRTLAQSVSVRFWKGALVHPFPQTDIYVKYFK